MTAQQNRRWLIGILVLAIISAFISFTNRKFNFKVFHMSTEAHLGLDIQGGLRVVLHPEVSVYNKQHPNDPWGPSQLNLVRKIIENRVNATGVAEPLIMTNEAANQIIVELPGVKNKQQAIEQLRSTASLQFYLLPQLGNSTNTRLAIWSQTTVKDPKTGQSQDVLIDNSTGKPVTQQQLEEQVFSKPNLLVATGADLLPNSKAVPDPNRNNQPIIEFSLDAAGARSFSETTRAHIHDFLAIFLDGKLLTAPSINDVISDSGEINGDFTVDSAKSLSDNLNAGALPVPLKLLETRDLQATLGRDAVRTTMIAGAVGLLVVLAFMLYSYRLPGLLADVALCLYAIFSYALFKVYPITLTLPGIAGFILSIGMAVDANILIFERFREELNSGKPLRAAIDIGFKRAFSAIFDSNICTLITCTMLFNFGSGPIRGFALTLGLGVVVSMFTAIMVTRTFLFALVNLPWAQNVNLYGLKVHEFKLHVMRKPWAWLGFSTVIIVPGIVLMLMGGIKPSIDFKGGTELTVSYAQPQSSGSIQAQLTKLGYQDSRVVLSDTPFATSNKYLAIITTRKLSDPERTALVSSLTNNGALLAPGQTLGNVQYANVSGVISKQLTLGAVWTVLAASILIVLYLTARFAIGGFKEGLKYGICAVIALLHDVLVVMGFFALMGKLLNWQVDSLFVTAMLTVIGFSVHDTIIVFDRIRENLQHRSKGETFADLADRSINQTLLRSIKTSFTVLIVLTMLVIFGSTEIQHFSAALWIGILSGTYSSIFNASVLLVMAKRNDPAFTVSRSPGTSASTRSKIAAAGDRPLVAASVATSTVPASASAADVAVDNPSTSASATAATEGGEDRTPKAPRRQPVRRRRM